MNKYSVLFFCVSLLSLVYAHADGLATELSPQVKCYQDGAAANILNLSSSNALRDLALLCSGATSSAPIKCYQDGAAANILNLSGSNAAVHDLALLCSGATSSTPIKCYRDGVAAKILNLSGSNAAVDDLAQLCKQK